MEIKKIKTMGKFEYFASTDGKIMRKHKHKPRKPSTRNRIEIAGNTFTILKPYARGKERFSENHYVSVDLEGRGTVSVHRLIAETFICDIGDNVVNHKNGIKNDNRVENLELITAYENLKHAQENGLRKRVDKKLVISMLENEHITQKDIATACGCSVAYVEKLKADNKIKRPIGYRGVRK